MPTDLRAGLVALLLLPVLACAGPSELSPADEPAPTRRLLVARSYVEADYERVWERFTRAEAFADWYTSPCARFGAAPGDELVWRDQGREIYRGRLRWIEHGRGLGWEFRFVGFGFEEPMTPVDVTIAPRGETVLVEIVHDVTGAPRTAGIVSEVGWTKPLSRLKTLLETGAPMPWPAEPEGDGSP